MAVGVRCGKGPARSCGRSVAEPHPAEPRLQGQVRRALLSLDLWEPGEGCNLTGEQQGLIYVSRSLLWLFCGEVVVAG